MRISDWSSDVCSSDLTTEYRSIQNYDDNTLNVCIPATYRFVDTVVDALAAMHEEAGVPLKTFHLGADETAGAWIKSTACKAMIAENGGDAGKLTPRFLERVTASLAAKGPPTRRRCNRQGQPQTPK